MGKRYDSPVAKYPGHVIMPDYFDWPQLIAYDDNLYRVAQLNEQLASTEGDREKTNIRYQLLDLQTDGILPMVEEWHIEGLPQPVTRFPATPITDAIKLAGWIIGLINSIKNGEEAPDPFLSVESGITSPPQS